MKIIVIMCDVIAIIQQASEVQHGDREADLTPACQIQERADALPKLLRQFLLTNAP